MSGDIERFGIIATSSVNYCIHVSKEIKKPPRSPIGGYIIVGIGVVAEISLFFQIGSNLLAGDTLVLFVCGHQQATRVVGGATK
jgi:hypothetical protein